MIPRGRQWRAPAVIAVLAVAALVLAASHGQAIRAYALDVSNSSVVAVVHPSQQVCEGPVTSHYTFQRVGIWATATAGSASGITVVEAATSHRVLASSDPTSVGTGEAELIPLLSHTIPADRPVLVCIEGRAGGLGVVGSPAPHPGVAVTGVESAQQFSLVLITGPHSGSLLRWLPTAFGRASLWRPSWFGTWVFWVLAGALLATFVVGVLAVLHAAAADAPPERPGGGGDEDDGPWRPPGGGIREQARSAA